MDIEFKNIAPRGGSKDRAFEELCCQLALAEAPDPREFRRVRGDGGDGGIECFWTDASGNMHGLQVKYIFDFDDALRKVKESLATARRNYPTLKRYVICLPFELSGSRGGAAKKGRPGKSQQDKFGEFKRTEESADSPIVVELWTAFHLRDRLLRLDNSGGRHRFWFDSAHLGSDWFRNHLDTAIVRAGPRYRPELHTGHVLDDTLGALGDTPSWRRLRTTWHKQVAELATKWHQALTTPATASGWTEPFPASTISAGQYLLSCLETLTASLAESGDLENALVASINAVARAGAAETELARDIDERFGRGMADSVPFRHMQAELMCQFPAHHLDECREINKVLRDLTNWLQAPAIRAAATRVLLLTGAAGIGKTHGLCDAAVRRRDAGHATVLVSGNQFSSDGSMWECLAAALGLDWSRDVLLDALNEAGAVTGRVLVVVDALDERARRTRWLDDLPELVHAIRRRPNLALCVAVRDGYQQQVRRDDLDLPTFSHPGFGEAVFDACTSFFNHFELEPPVGPLLEPEFGNPLFLLTLCRTLKARCLTSVPTGWRSGTKRVFEQLLAARDEGLQQEFPGAGRRGVSKAMSALAEALPEGGSLQWHQADEIVQQSLPASQRGHIDLLDYLVGLGLLRVVPGENDSWANEDDRLDIAFGRLRHHLIAERLTLAGAASDDKLRAAAVEDPGLAESLALILPERGRGELVDLAVEPDERRQLLQRWLISLPWRDADTLGVEVEALIMEGLGDERLESLALDALVTLALRPGHRYDHRFFHDLLVRCGMPGRDASLCLYLHEAFERTSPPSPVLRALRAPWEADLARVEPQLLEAWCVVLCWCCSAADRRVRDHATKAAVRLTEPNPSIWPRVVALFAEVDDDSVLERVLCSAYGAVLQNPDAPALHELALCVRDRILRSESGTPQHALVRGHAQSIGEWAAHRGVLPVDVRVEDFRPPHDVPTEITVPTEEDLQQFDSRGYQRIWSSVMSEWTGDFAKYTMPITLKENEAILGRDATRRWVLGTVVVELGYLPELHGYYDSLMVQTHGPGRARPEWAERIGKKYQWIALARLVGLLDDHARSRVTATDASLRPSPDVAFDWRALNRIRRPRLAVRGHNSINRYFRGRRWNDAHAHFEGPETPMTFVCAPLRDLDPSLLRPPGSDPDRDAGTTLRWWEPVTMDFASSAASTDEAWAVADDFPDASRLVSPLVDPSRPGQRWRLLEGHFDWDDRPRDGERDKYRRLWMMIKGYIVPRQQITGCWEALKTVDFMGTRMVKGTVFWGGMYVGEYPWASTFPQFGELPEARGEETKFEGFGLRPVANRLNCLADADQEETRVTVPSAELVVGTATRWDGSGGFKREDGSLVFQDPSFKGGGPRGLWIDDDVLAQLLLDLDVGLLWTVLAERQVLGGGCSDTPLPMPHISLVMYLDGQVVREHRGPVRGANDEAGRGDVPTPESLLTFIDRLIASRPQR
jgi:hypothetical protein